MTTGVVTGKVFIINTGSNNNILKETIMFSCVRCGCKTENKDFCVSCTESLTETLKNMDVGAELPLKHDECGCIAWYDFIEEKLSYGLCQEHFDILAEELGED